jgi:hypothetical protein
MTVHSLSIYVSNVPLFGARFLSFTAFPFRLVYHSPAESTADIPPAARDQISRTAVTVDRRVRRHLSGLVVHATIVADVVVALRLNSSLPELI